MTIDEAIKLLDEQVKLYPILRRADITEALILGIEALKRVKLLRDNLNYPHEKPLYGETEE